MLKPSMIRPRSSFASVLGIVFAVLCFGATVGVGTYRLLQPYAEQHDHPAATATRSAGANNTINASGSSRNYAIYTPAAPSDYYAPRLIDANGQACFAHIDGGHGLTGDIGLSSYAGACRLVFGWQAPEQYQCVFDVGIVDPATIASVDRTGFYFSFQPSNALRHIRYSCTQVEPVHLNTSPFLVNGNTTLGDAVTTSGIYDVSR